MRSPLFALGVLGGFGTVRNAAPINVPVPTNAYIVQNGLDWAWANPLPADVVFNPPNNGLDLSFQSQFGCGIPINSLWPRLRPRFCSLTGMYLLVCFLLVDQLESIP